jgi:hypothetical protein
MAKKNKPEKPTIEGIRAYKTQLVGSTDNGAGGYYAALRQEQQTDQEFKDDIFKTSIKAPYHEVRLGTASRIVDTVTHHIDTSNPQAFREPRNDSAEEKKRCTKVNRLLNHRLKLLLEEIEESVKNGAQRGELFYQLDYNPNYNPSNDDSFPTVISAPDPMIIYPDPHEYLGIPFKAIKCNRMNVGQIQRMYPEWSNPKNRKPDDKEGVEYFAYWDENWRYFEADGEPLLKGEDGINENILGYVPIVHAYSGFGKKSPQGKPETKAVGVLRTLRGRLIEECEVESRIDSMIGLFANPVVDLSPTDPNVKITPADAQEVSYAPGSTNILKWGMKKEITQGEVPSAQMFQHLYEIKQSLGYDLPPVAFGLPSTSRATGRQEDIYSEHYRKKFSKLITNAERALATILGLELRYLEASGSFPITVRATVIDEKGKKFRQEETITAKDIGGYYDCTVQLKAPNELEQDKKIMLYRGLMNESRVSWKTGLIKGLGYTEDEAEDEINEVLAEQAWRTNPALLNMVFEEALEDAGMGRLLDKVREKTRMAQAAQQSLEGMPKGQVRPSEAKNPFAKDVVRQRIGEQPYGIRQSPEQYQQEGGL